MIIGTEIILDVAQTIMVGDDPRFNNYTQPFSPEDLLSAQDVQVYQQLADAYKKYADKDLPSYARLVQVIHDYYQQPHDEEPSFSNRLLMKVMNILRQQRILHDYFLK